MSTFTHDDKLWIYQLKVKEATMKSNNDVDHIVRSIYSILTDYHVGFLDIRSLGSASKSHGVFDKNHKYIGSECVVNDATIGIVTYVPLETDMIENILLCPNAYPMICCESLTITSATYEVKDLEIELALYQPSGQTSACGCTIHKRKTYPFVGLYKGTYMDSSKAKLSHYDSTHAASWNHKSDPAIQSIKAIEAHPVRTASISKSQQEIWSFGFGWTPK